MFTYMRDELRLLRCGASARDRLHVLTMGVRFHARARGIELPRQDERVTLRLRTGVDLELRRSDYYILFEIFGLRGYEIDLRSVGRIDSVLDLGANIGFATIFLSDALPNARFVCVEPSSASFALLERNLARNVPAAVAIRAAVTAKPTEVEVVEGRHSALTRIRPPSGTGERIRGATVSELLDEAGIPRVSLMKLDVEGGERALFDSAAMWADRVGAVLAEIHPPLTPDGCAAGLAEHGYGRIQLPRDPRLDSLLLVAQSARPTGSTDLEADAATLADGRIGDA